MSFILSGLGAPRVSHDPVAIVAAEPEFGVVGSVVRLDGRQSSDPSQFLLSYEWSFVSVPIGSKVQLEGFRVLQTETDPSAPVPGSPMVVSFSPDIVGEYVIGLIVSNGTYESLQTTKVISIRAMMIPHGRGLVPDGKFLWSYIRDVWSQVESREWFETLWSALLQIVGAEMLKLYQVDFNKSIRDVQDKFQRRWLAYEPKLTLYQPDLSFFLDNQQAGTSGSTQRLGIDTQAIITSADELIVVRGSVLPDVSGKTVTIKYGRDVANVGSYVIQTVNQARNSYKLNSPYVPNPLSERVLHSVPFFFAAGSTTWSMYEKPSHEVALAMSMSGSVPDQLLSLWAGLDGTGTAAMVVVGDIILYPSGPNAGLYRVLQKSGTFFVVDKAPVATSDIAMSTTYKADVYRPVGIHVDHTDVVTGQTFAVPAQHLGDIATGRLVVMGGRSYTVVRSQIDTQQVVPLTLITADTEDVPTDISGMAWRAPHTLVSSSQNFEELGVSPGDLLVLELLLVGSQISVEVEAQVVGVDRHRLGFVLTNKAIVDGEIAEIPNETYLKISKALNLQTVTEDFNGDLVFTGFAAYLNDSLLSPAFQEKFFNVKLDPYSEIKVEGLTFQIKPKTIVRNSRLPVDRTLLSIPLLQEYIKQPLVMQNEDGTWAMQRGDTAFPISRKPQWLSENIDYIIDDEKAISEKLTFPTGTNVVEADTGDFVDRNILPGDMFSILSPLSIAGEYIVDSVLSPNRLKLTRPIPLYALGKFVTAKVKLIRRNAGRFIRFVPGLYSASTPAPDRLWAEVSFFDNSSSIEDNFGILVGLKKDDLDSVSTNATYRQAVAGLMYALTKGSAVSKIELGVKILLGLPYAEARGVVRSIENDYRVDTSGVPTMGRILIDDIDADNVPLGTVRVYTYPLDPASHLAGVDINPQTGEEYKVGDIVEKFASLSKGVQVIDYLNEPYDQNVGAQRLLQQYHSLRVRVNSDIFNVDELTLVSGFLKKITPSHVAYVVDSLAEYEDKVDITDVIFLGLKLGNGGGSLFSDNVSTGLPFSISFDQYTAGGIPFNLDAGYYLVRRAGRDLSTSFGSATATITTAGFLNPRTGESFDAPLCKIGDKLVVLSGPNAGVYTVSGITDSTVTVSDGPASGFSTASTQRYAILRSVTSTLRSGSVLVTNGAAQVPFGSGLRTDSVMPGDWVVFSNLNVSPRRFKVVSVDRNGTTGAWDKATLTPTPVVTGGPVTSSYRIVRPGLIESPGRDAFSVTSAGGNTLTEATNFLKTLADPMDELQLQSSDLTRVTVLDPVRLYVTPALPAGTYTVKLIKKNHTDSLGGATLAFSDPVDEITLSSYHTGTPNASCTASSNDVAIPATGPYDLGAKPGDLLVLVGGTNGGVDVGYGSGVYPIVGVSSGHVTLSVNLTATETLNWKIMRTR
jgi:hypothetical protein